MGLLADWVGPKSSAEGPFVAHATWYSMAEKGRIEGKYLGARLEPSHAANGKQQPVYYFKVDGHNRKFQSAKKELASFMDGIEVGQRLLIIRHGSSYTVDYEVQALS